MIQVIQANQAGAELAVGQDLVDFQAKMVCQELQDGQASAEIAVYQDLVA